MFTIKKERIMTVTLAIIQDTINQNNQMSRNIVLCALLLLQINVFAIQQDTLILDEVVLKSTLINQANPALSVSEISY